MIKKFMVYDTYTNQKLTFVNKNRMNYIRIARRIILGLIIILGICIVAASVGAVNIPFTDTIAIAINKIRMDIMGLSANLQRLIDICS